MGPQALLLWSPEATAAANSETFFGNNIKYTSAAGIDHVFADEASYIYQNSGTIQFYTANCAAADADFNGGERMRLDKDGQIGIGTTTPTHTLDVEGYINANSGIQFQGDTAAANALDDYEEGTWTPVLGAHISNGTHSYTTQIGRYTKIGNVVHVWFNLAIDTLNTSGAISGNLQMLNLPFTSNATAGLYSIGTFVPVGLDFDGGTGPVSTVAVNLTVVQFIASVDNASYDTFTSADVASGDQFWGHNIYMV